MAFPELVKLLQAVASADVEVLVIGMLAGVLQGVPIMTLDLDLLHRRTPENVAKLVDLLESLDARYRGDPRNVGPRADLLALPDHNLFTTRLGDLDCLGAIVDDLTYDDLVGESVEVAVGEGLFVRALSLEQLIDIKQRTGRPKALPTLRASLDEARKRST
jgi:hypothetical protein